MLTFLMGCRAAEGDVGTFPHLAGSPTYTATRRGVAHDRDSALTSEGIAWRQRDAVEIEFGNGKGS
jgi:hypothetical protein